MPCAERRSHRSADPRARAESRARAARERALREGNAGRPAAGARYVRAGLRELGWAENGGRPDAEQVDAGHHGLAARLLGILAEAEAEQGRTEYGLGLLNRAEDLAAADDRGIVHLQRGLIFMRTWRRSDALEMLDEAVTLLEQNPAETVNLAWALINRSVVHLSVGDVRQARADLLRCRQIAPGGGHDQQSAKVLHNLGYCDLLAGDIPGALQLFNAAADAYRVSAPGVLPILAMDKARLMLAAGLAGDAARELDGAMAAFRRQRLDHDLAEAELARAEAALAAGEPAVASHWAGSAERHFRRNGNEACACLAELTRLRARFRATGRPATVADAALGLAGRLRERGLVNDADLADLLAARALIAAGRPDQARRQIATARRPGPAAPLTARLLGKLARAELAEREGRPGAALTELRAGLSLVQARRGRLGSIDLRTGTAALGADLAAAGLRLALERESAALVFAWLERSRAQAFRARPVRPPADPQAAAVLAELRQLGYLIREAELNGGRDARLVARQAELQREIREHDWQASGLGEVIVQASLSEVGATLEQAGQTLVGIIVQPGRMLAVVVRRGSARLVQLGDFEATAEAARRQNADLDTLAGRRLPARLAAVIGESVRHQAGILMAEVIAPLRSAIGDDGLVIVPAGPLADIPWGVLPGLRGRPVSVCPSASAWLTAWRRARATAPDTPPLLVAGPDLEHADLEIAEIARCYPDCRPLLSGTATVGAALRALDGAPLAHLAAHGHHDQENFLFSRVDLADGPLMAYDIQQLTAAPRHVVLSSCDVGRTVVRPGEEILGFTAALLYIGTATVTSSVTRVGDDDAVGTMAAYHRLLAAGIRPAEALAEATAAEQFSPFVCFGGG